jgi:hypothetical protein
MYSSARRARLLRDLETQARSLEAVEGLIVVGSGAHDFTDDMSDLDVILVVDPVDKLQPVVEAIAKSIDVDHRPLVLSRYRHHAEVHVLCYLFEDMLELDLGIWSLSRLFASKPEWKIQYSKSDRVVRKLEDTVHSPPVPDQTGEALLQSMWIQARAAVVAISRNQTFKATSEINAIRTSTVKLICESNGFANDFERNIEKIDDPLVSLLRRSFGSSTSPAELLAALDAVCTAGLEAIDQIGIDVREATTVLRRLLHRPW